MHDNASSNPEFRITVDDGELPAGQRGDVRRIHVTEALAAVARASILLRNWDAESNGPEDEDDGFKFAVGQTVSIELGYGTDLETVFEGLVVALRARCETGESQELEVICRCRGAILRGPRLNRVWNDATDLAAVTEIGGKANLSVVGQAAFDHPFLVQRERTDWDFVLDRARALGLVCYVRGTKLHFHGPTATGNPVAELIWPDNVQDVRVVQDVRNSIASAQTGAWSADSKTTLSAKATPDSSAIDIGDRASEGSLLGAAKMNDARGWTAAVSVGIEQAELEAWGQSQIDDARLRAYHGRATIDGNAAVRIDGLVTISGVGSSFDGPHYVSAVMHEFDPGQFRTRIKLGLADGNAPGGAERPPRPMVPRESLMVAQVESFEDSDKSEARVQVRFPWMSEQDPPVWARLASSAGGAGRGVLFVPEPGDEVLVQFLDGDPRFAVVVGSLWNAQDTPPSDYDAEKNDRRAIVSRLGHTVTFDDGDDAPGVTVKSAAGQTVCVNDTGGSEAISLEDKAGNTLVMDDSGIALTAAAGKKIVLSASGGEIQLSAQNITGAADSALSLKASGSAEVKALGSLDLAGAQVNVKGDAQAAVSAPMVRIN